MLERASSIVLNDDVFLIKQKDDHHDLPGNRFCKISIDSERAGRDLGNIGEIVSGSGTNHSAAAPLIISLINIEENRMSRDPNNYIRDNNGIGLLRKNPAIHLNLTLLFTSVRHEGGYELALNDVQQVIGVFQNQYAFDATTNPQVPDGIEKLILEMISLNLEQLHQLWSMLGGKYHPSIAYRMRMVTIDSVSDEPGPLIEQIEANYKIK